VIDNEIIVQIHRVYCVGYDVFCCCKDDVNIKLGRFKNMCGTIQRTLKSEALRTTLLKFYKVMAIPTLMYICENWILNRTDR
jgi:hypothetical protein